MTHGAALAESPAPQTPEPLSLPGWDLSDLYSGPDCPRLAADLARADQDSQSFRDQWCGRIAHLDAPDLARAIRAYEALSDLLGRIGSFAQLRHAADMTDIANGQFLQAMTEKSTALSSRLIFFTLELNALEDAALDRLLADPALAPYQPWIRDLRLFRPHQLSDDMERLLHEKDMAGRGAWVRLFDETIAHLTFPVGSETLSSTEVFDRLSDPRPERRRAAFEAIGQVLGNTERLFARITNTLALDKQIEDTWRHHPTPLAARNLANRVEDAVVEALVSSVRDSYADISHRYYALKARWFGKDQLDPWDRNAPLPDSDDTRFTWAEARDCVLGAYRAFSPDLAAVGQRFFDNPWIDAAPRKGKAPGAFAHPTVPSAHPYLLVNFMGRSRDVMTLAHELGHGVHQVLSAPRGALMADAPLTLAETASVFGEMLTFRALLDQTTDPVRRRVLLAGKVEDMINTVVRQIAFHTFEVEVHTQRQSGELSPDQLGDIWMTIQQESLGPAFRYTDSYRPFWSYIPHFIHAPFYVYAYAFGDCLVNSLYAVYRDGSLPDFADTYLAMLAAGGTARHGALLAPFGLDATDPAFWRRGLAMISGLIDDLEALDRR